MTRGGTRIGSGRKPKDPFSRDFVVAKSVCLTRGEWDALAAAGENGSATREAARRLRRSLQAKSAEGRLLPCPHCKGEVKLARWEDEGMLFAVICPKCGIEACRAKAVEETVRTWNDRSEKKCLS